MRFMLMFKTGNDVEAGIPPCKDEPAMVRFIGELTDRGVLQSTEGLYPSDRGAVVERRAGHVHVTDGPFAEAKEIVAGYAIVNATSKSAAVALAGQFLEIAGEGVAEVREVIESPSAS
jgi:hypothetical protein